MSALFKARRALRAVVSLALMAFLMSSGMRVAVSLMRISYHDDASRQAKPIMLPIGCEVFDWSDAILGLIDPQNAAKMKTGFETGITDYVFPWFFVLPAFLRGKSH